MRCEATVLPASDPFVALRRDFERRAGLNGDANFGDIRVENSESGVLIEIDVPGAVEENLDLTIQDGQLVLSGRRNVTVPEGATEVFSNRGPSEFHRVLKIHDSIDIESVDAVVANGILAVQLQRRPESGPKRIEIRAHSGSQEVSEVRT